jgi:hypothetical protein
MVYSCSAVHWPGGYAASAYSSGTSSVSYTTCRIMSTAAGPERSRSRSSSTDARRAETWSRAYAACLPVTDSTYRTLPIPPSDSRSSRRGATSASAAGHHDTEISTGPLTAEGVAWCRYNRTLQTEWAYPQVFTTNTDRTHALAPWLHFYATGRRHSALGGQPRPADCHGRPPGTPRPSETAAEGLIQIAKQLPDAPAARRCRGVAAEHIDDGWCRAPASLLNVLGADISIIASDAFGRSRRVGRCSENVLHLVGVGQWMQVRSGCCVPRCSRRIARGRRVCVSGRLVRRPRGVAQCLPALTASSERPCGVDRVARAGVGRVCALEDLQDFLRARSGVPGDLTKVLHAQNDLAGFVRHGYRPRRPHWTPPLSYSALGSAAPDQPTVMNVSAEYI